MKLLDECNSDHNPGHGFDLPHGLGTMIGIEVR